MSPICQGGQGEIKVPRGKSKIPKEVRARISSEGGKARAKTLDQSQRTAIAQKAALARWSNKTIKTTRQDPQSPLDSPPSNDPS